MEKRLQKLHIRHCILHLFHCGINAANAARIIQETYGDKATSIRVCQQWYKRFIDEGFDLNDKPIPNRGIKLRSEDLKALYLENPSMTSRQIAEQLGVHFTTISKRLVDLGLRKPGKPRKPSKRRQKKDKWDK